MNITKVEIYGYGKIIQQSLVFDTGFNAVFGRNEAGKTTWMDFIRHVLFGFPTKKGSARQYLPKMGGVCGGCLHLETEQYGLVKVERILTAQKVTGEVKVFLADGEEKDESFLPQLLDGMTESIFLNVFHFGLDGLQEMQKKKGEDISDFLFATAVFGEKTRSQFVENQEKEMKLLFKERGKSKIAHELENIEQLYTDLQAWKKKEQDYQNLLEMRNQLQQQMQEKKREIKKDRADLEKLKQFLTVQPTLAVYQTVQQRVQQLQKTPFVKEDVRTWLKEKMKVKETLQNECRKIEEDLRRLESQMLDAKSDYFFHMQEIPFKEDAARMEKMELAFENYRDRLKENERNRQVLSNQLGEHIDEEFLQALPSQFFMREQLKQLIQRYEAIMAEIMRIQSDIQVIESEMQNRQLQIQKLQQPPFENRKALTKELEARNQLDECKRNLEQLYAQRIAQHKGNSNQPENIPKGKKTFTPQILLGVSSLLLIVVIFSLGLLQQNWLIVGFSLFLLLILLFQMPKKGNSSAAQSMDDYVNIQIAGLELQLEKMSQSMPREKFELLEKMTQDEERRAEFLAEQKALTDLQQSRYKQRKIMEQKMHEQQMSQAQAKEILQGLWLPAENLSMTFIAYLDGCFALKQCLQEKKRLQNEQFSLEKQYQACLLHWEDQFESFSKSRGSFEVLMRDWEVYKSQLERKNAQNEQIARQYIHDMGNRRMLVRQLEQLQARLNDTYAQTPFRTEEEFIKEDEQWQLYQRECRKKEELYEQLEYFFIQSGYQEENLETFDVLEEKQLHLQCKLEEDEHLLDDLQNQLYGIENQIYEVEAGVEKFHYQSAYDYSKGILYEDIFEWLVLAQMMDQFQSVMDVFQKEKMPRVLAHMSEYFQQMTCGAYQKVEICTDIQRFIVQNKQEIRFEVQELSRGTKEQLYTALRLAMAEVSPFQVKVPFIIDDSFVNFDTERLASVLRILKDLSEQFQIIYFTCNADVHDSISRLTDVVQPKIS